MLRYFVNPNYNLKRAVAILIIIAVFTAAFMYNPVAAVAACSYPCFRVLDTSVAQQAVAWFYSFAEPYMSAMWEKWQMMLRQKMIRGLLGLVSDEFLKNSFDITNELNRSLPVRVQNVTGLIFVPDLVNASYPQRSDGLSDDARYKYASKAYTVGEECEKLAIKNDETLEKIKPSKLDFLASSGVKKDVAKYSIIQGEILASTLRVMGTKGELNGFIK